MRLFRTAAGLGSVALLLACGNGISEQNGPNLGGSGPGGGGGMGGGMMVGGSGGGGGSGNVASVPDAGPDGGGNLGGGGGFTYPSGCPVPDPIGIPGQVVAIQSFNFDNSELVLRNISPATQTIIGERLGWQWCSFPSYWNIAPAGDVVLEPGETYKFQLINNQQGVWPLPPEGSELAIYIESGTFDEPEKLVSFVSWGEGLVTAGREYVATLAELWTYQERIEIDSGDSGFIATGSTNRASGYVSVSARCLVAPDNR